MSQPRTITGLIATKPGRMWYISQEPIVQALRAYVAEKIRDLNGVTL